MRSILSELFKVYGGFRISRNIGRERGREEARKRDRNKDRRFHVMRIICESVAAVVAMAKQKKHIHTEL